MNTEFETILKKHGYQRAGMHAAVKTCLWLNKSLRNQAQCYKSQFYGITSHCCIQMTPTLRCNQKCLHCWRPTELETPKTRWDPPELIAEETLKAQQRLISGYGGADTTNKTLWEEAKTPKHVAISLAGEPTLYPYLNKLINTFHNKHLTTFVVSNGSRPTTIERINPTQLYLSLNAPDKTTYQQICNPQEEHQWENLQESLEHLREKPTKTAIRITLIEGLNIKNPEKYAELITQANPDYVEIKAYMHLGYSRKRLKRNAMPPHQRIHEFSQKITKYTPYKLTDENQQSRVVLLTKKQNKTQP
jgi:tRNA wybutosine-synthesizing protein 1